VLFLLFISVLWLLRNILFIRVLWLLRNIMCNWFSCCCDIVGVWFANCLVLCNFDICFSLLCCLCYIWLWILTGNFCPLYYVIMEFNQIFIFLCVLEWWCVSGTVCFCDIIGLYSVNWSCLLPPCIGLWHVIDPVCCSNALSLCGIVGHAFCPHIIALWKSTRRHVPCRSLLRPCWRRDAHVN
jgi:hypothetical protein